MKVGFFGARSDSRGLAYQSLGYVKHLPFSRVYGIDMTADDLSPYPCNWRPYELLCDHLTINRRSRLDEQDIRKWLRGLDIVLAAETFYLDNFPTIAREEGVITVQHCNPEFTPWVVNPDRWQLRSPTPRPDILALPTTWLLDSYPDAVHLPFPVDRLEFPFRLRTSAKKFVHVAGHRAASDRAGTRIVMGAIPRLKDIDVTIRSQSPLGYSSPFTKGKVEEGNVAHPRELYADADVVVIPRRYGGNSLVHQEALSSGCPVISLDRAPENTWGGVITIPSRARSKMRTKGGTLPIHDGVPQHLARTIQELVADDGLVEAASYAANEHARMLDWDRWADVYGAFFLAVKHGQSTNVLRGIASALLQSRLPDMDGPAA